MVTKIRILYVDDEENLLEISKLFLERSGQFSVDIVTSAPAALTLLNTKNYDAIISDYQMPDMDGIEFLKKIRTSGNTIPFILFTGRGREEIVIQALNEGADFYLQKGSEPKSQFAELSHKIRQAVQKRLADVLLRERETQLRVILESTADGILAVDNTGKVLQVSTRLAEIWRVPKSVIETGDDRTLLDFAQNQLIDPDAFLKKVQSLCNSDAVDMDTLAFKDGRVIERYSFPMIMDGTRIGRVWSFRDVTEKKQSEEIYRQAYKKLNLLSVISRHDINNQIMVLQSYLAVLEMEELGLAHNEYFRKVAATTQRISGIIKFTKECEEIGVNAPAWQDCHTIVKTAAKQAPTGKVIVKNDIPSGTEMFADPLVVKVFYNLMDNAERYGGKITTIRFSVEECNGDHILVCGDDGDGIPAEEKERIFERGFGKNTGMGLFLAREILSITDITIRETGVPGEGARFEIAVPHGSFRI